MAARKTTPSATRSRSKPVEAHEVEGSRGQVLVAVEGWLATLDLDELGAARAALSRTLATKLDQVLDMDAAQAAMAVPGISKELREVLDAIQEASDDAEEFVTGLFAEVGNSAKS